jgi:hypothetical protein
MIRTLAIAYAISQGAATEDLKREGIDGFKRGGFEAVAWVELGCIIALGAALVIREKQHRADVAAKDLELRDLNKVTRDALISDSKAIDAMSKALDINTAVIRELKR